MMSPEELKALIASDPEALQAATEERWKDCAKRCGEIAPVLNRILTAMELQRAASLRGIWGKVRLVAEPGSGYPPEVRAAAITFVDWIAAQFPIDLTLPELQPMVQTFIAAGLMTQQDIEDMLRMTEQGQRFTPLECRVAMKGA